VNGPVAFTEADGRSWRCTGCGSSGRACGGDPASGSARARENVQLHIEDCTPHEDLDALAQAIHDPKSHALVMTVIRREARIDPEWFAGLLRLEARIQGRPLT
jgi:hypothetical protein